jgi:anti-sigma B factor antagonist
MSMEKDPSTDPSDVDPDASFDLTGGSPLQIIVSHKEGRTRVALMGELDGATAPFLREKLVDVATELVGDLELDIGLLTFVDWAGLSLLVTIHKHLAAKGRNLVIVAPTPMARRLFEITSLNQVLQIEPFRPSRRGR